jgi:hypothetical protein
VTEGLRFFNGGRLVVGILIPILDFGFSIFDWSITSLKFVHRAKLAKLAKVYRHPLNSFYLASLRLCG